MLHVWLFTFFTVQALKMRYFSNRPGPTPGPQLPRPNCSVEALKEKETMGLKRKIDGLASSNAQFLNVATVYKLYLL